MKKLTLFFILLIILASCDKREVEVRFDPILSSESGMIPLIYPGNTSCEELEGSYVSSTGKIDFVNGSFVFESGSGWPYGLEVTVSADGRYVGYTLPANSQYCVGAVIVKGGNASNVFTYDMGVKSDEGLSAPINSSGSPAQLSNLTFCFVECQQKPPVVIAVKSWIWLSQNSMENSVWSDYTFTMSTGQTVFTTGNWCDALGIINYPGTNSALLSENRGTISIVEGDVNGVNSLIITVDLNEGLIFESTSLYFGNLGGLTAEPLSADSYTFGCPLYGSWPHQNTSKVNTHTFIIPY